MFLFEKNYGELLKIKDYCRELVDFFVNPLKMNLPIIKQYIMTRIMLNNEFMPKNLQSAEIFVNLIRKLYMYSHMQIFSNL